MRKLSFFEGTYQAIEMTAIEFHLNLPITLRNRV